MRRKGHFSDPEFNGWADRLAPEQEFALSLLRARWGRPIHVSPVEGAVGRNLGPNAGSWHNIDNHGEVYATDLFPEGLRDASDVLRFKRLATECGFTGIGFYSRWSWPSKGLVGGFHVDTRTDTMPLEPALWGQIESPGYCEFDEALQDFRDAR